MRSIIVFDLDGTLADNQHRLHYLLERPKNWRAFHDACVFDKPFSYLIRIYNSLAFHLDVAICTGRPDSHRQQTTDWMLKYGVTWPSRLYMRGVNDHRPDVVVKKEMLDRLRSDFDVICAIEDRPSMVRAWRENGVPCLAVDDSSWQNPPYDDPGNS